MDKIDFLEAQEGIAIIISAAADITAMPVIIVRKNASVIRCKANR
ncbi:putative membrane protein (plasmid) [Duffyella gerundensis]|uniref:Putative membrane protein n=1 Tax=Duffyella gerundensis TaxID=1619313 RepID=A0A0U5LAH1_9GAMM|nr:putative membrane protein [Duffyella gerundensis]